MANTYSTFGKSGTTSVLFTRKFTADDGFTFTTAPSIDLSEVANSSDYSYTTEDTGSIAESNLTAREFVVSYKHSEKQNTTNDIITFNANAVETYVASTGKIYSFEVDTSTIIPYEGVTRKLTIYGDAEATLTVAVSRSILASGTATIGSDGKYETNLVFPEATGAATYNITLTEIASGSFPDHITSGATAATFTAYGRIGTTFEIQETGSDFTIVSTPRNITYGNANEYHDKLVDIEHTISSSSTMSIDAANGWDITDYSSSTSTETTVGDTVTMDGTTVQFIDTKIIFDNSGGTKYAYLSGKMKIYRGTTSETVELVVNNIIDI